MPMQILIPLVLFIAATGYLLIRIERVHRFRMNLIDRIHEAAMTDIRSSGSPAWRWRVYQNGPTFNDMLLSFKPLTVDRWYPDTSFLKPNEES